MWHLKQSLSPKWLLISLLSLAMLAVACGSSAVQEPPAAQKEATPKAAVKEATPKAAVKDVPAAAVVVATPVPAPKQSLPVVNAGKLTIMVPDFSTERFDRVWTAGEGANAYMIYLHSALVESDANRKMVPGIASEWSLSSDGKSYSFKIRKGVKFHDGTELTPEDALWTYQHSFGAQALDYAVGSGYLKAAKIIDQISLTEPDVLTISFTKPYLDHGPGESNAGISPTGIMPGRVALNDTEVSEAFDRDPIGAGSMMLTDQTPQSSMTFERFDDHYYQPANGLPEDRRPQFQNLELVLVSELATRVAALRAGEADIVPVQLSAKSQVEAGGGRLVFIAEGVAYDNPWIHCWAMAAGHPCKNKQVRQALNYAINKEVIRDKLYGGPDVFSIGGLGFITPSVQGYTSGLDPFPFDPDKARQLLAEAGYPGGVGFPTAVKLNAAPSGVIPFLVETAQYVGDSWKKELNIPVEVIVHDYSAMKKKRRTDELDGEIYFSRKAVAIDPTVNVFRFYGSDEEDKRRGHDLELMQRVKDATHIVDQQARAKAFQKVLPEVLDEALTLNLGYVNTPWAVGPRVEAWEPWPLTDYASAIWTVKLK
jgi:peptide/nickel transport system substrate-binding protein